jgi:hypothetical protein
MDNLRSIDEEVLTNKKLIREYCDLTDEVDETFCILDIAMRFAEGELSKTYRSLGSGLYYAFSRYKDAKKKLEEFVDPLIRPEK